ncbi:PKD domain-containing protein [Polaribacter sp. IC073]|uniref:PKD domain-containing protein n=1 Tax=Polaribacter sp. IC073 TaxID=2508540 RepID=UPI0016792B32|nr:PKD domain-containing protein [Polaribacter sp. IC073]
MKIKKAFSDYFKNKTYYITLFLVCGILLNTYADLSNSKLFDFSEGLSATISVSKTTICINESTTVTFEAKEGTAPFIFTYTIAGVEDIKKTVGSADKTISFDFNNSTPKDYVFILTKVEDSLGEIVNITNQEETITVNAPPTVDFSFNNDSACSGETIQFTNNSTGAGTLTYSWDFADGTPISTQPNPTHIFDALGCGTKTFNVMLTVTDENGCSSSKSKAITVKEKPELKFRDLAGEDFSNCNSNSNTDSYEITVEDIAFSTCNIAFFVDWGDGTTPSAVTFPANHTYSNIGVYTMKIKGVNGDGCENEVSYIVKNISNPGGSIESPGNTSNLCIVNSDLIFGIGKYESNSPDTTYEIDFGDSSPTEIYTQTEIENNNQISHKYEKGSCSEPDGQFIVTLYVNNACKTTTFQVDSVIILEPSSAEFESIDNSCINTSIVFNNKSIIGNGNNCTVEADFTWDFGDGSTIERFISINGINNIEHTYTQAGTYTVTLTVGNNKCGTDVFTKEICIEPEITTSFSVDNEEGCIPLTVKTTNSTDESELCSKSPTYLWTVNYTSDNCGTSDNWEFTNSTNKNSENPEFIFNNPGKYTLTQKITTECGTKSATKIIDVKKPPTVNIQEIIDACGNTTINPTATVENCTTNTGSIIYNWTFTGGTPENSTDLNPGNIEYTTPGKHTITLEVTSECGVSNTASQEFEVFEKPIIINTDLTQEICSAQSTSEIILNTDNPNTTFSWTAIATPGISGFLTSGNSKTIPAQILTNSENSVGTVTYTAIPKLGTCEGDSVEFIVTVNPAPIFTTQPISSEICLGGTATPLEVAYQNGTEAPSYQWYSNIDDDNTTGTEITGKTDTNYTPPANTVGETFYYVEISFASGGCDKITSNTANVNVVPQIAVDPVTTPQTICVGGNAGELEVTFSGGTGNPTYQWFSNTNNTNTGGSKITGATASTFTPNTFSSNGNFYYYAKIYLDGNGCNTDTSGVFEINVLTDPIIDTQPISSQELCQSATPLDLNVTVSGGTTSTKNYQWYQNNSNSNTGGTLISGANATTYTPTTTSVGTFYYYVIVSQTESDCSVTSTISQLKVNEAPIITTQPAPYEICLDGTATTLEVAYINGTGTATYQWFSNTTDVNSGGNPIASETNNTYNPPTSTVGEIFYYAEISFTTGGCDKIVSNTASVKVQPQITVNAIADPQTICVGGNAGELEVTFSGGTGNPTYQWFSNTTNSNTGGSEIDSITNSTFTPNSFSTDGTFYYYVEISLNGNGCNTATSGVFEINVLTDPIIDTQPIASQELCQSAIPTDLIVVASGGTTSDINYQWYQNNSNSNTGGTLIPTANSATYMPVTTSVGTFYYYVIVSQTESDCSVTSDVSILKVNEAPIFSKQPIASEICLNGSATTLEVAYTNGTGTPTYQWFSNVTDVNSGGNPIAGETNNSYNPPANTVGETFYYIEVSFTTGGCDKIVSNTASVKVEPQITVNPVADPQTICVGGTTNEMEVTFSGGTGNPSYQWFSNTANSNIDGIVIASATDSKFTPNPFSSNGAFYFYAEIYLDGNGCSLAKSDAFEIKVLTDPVIDTQPIASQELCQSAIPTDLIVVASGGTTSDINYQWYQNNSNSNTGGTLIPTANSATYMPVTTSVGTFYYYVIVSQTESDCSATSDVSKLKVNEAPIFSKQPIASEICLNGSATTLEVDYTNGTGTATYQWFSNTTDVNSGGNPIAGETNNSYNPPTDAVGEIFYYAEISFSTGGCNKIVSSTASVIVNEIPVINSAETTIYSEATFIFNPNSIIGNTVPLGTKYTWSAPIFNPAGSIIGASSETIPQDQISQTLENTGTSPIKVFYTITPATIKCTGSPFTLEVTVNPSINSNAAVLNNSCFQSNDASISTNIIGGIPFETGSPYLIFWTGPNGFTSTDASITNLEVGLYTLKIEDRDGFSITKEFTIIQPNILSISKDVEKNISCFEGNDGAIEVTISGGTFPYSYNWITTDGAGIVQNFKNQNTLTAGTYTLEITDKNNCTIATNFRLTEPDGLKIETVSKQEILCFEGATGAVEINVSGGTLVEISPGVFDYLYNWSGPNGFISSSKNINNLVAGTYIIAVTDNLGCTTNASIIINQSSEIEISYTKTDVTCYGQTNGAIDVTVIGGKAPYIISWSNLANGFSLSNLSGNTYTATITDANNCIEQVSIIIEQPIFFTAPIITPISCNGENDGVIDLNLSGGIPPITVTWSDDASAGLQRNNLASGTYTVIILDSDEDQCPIEQTFTLTNPPAIAVSTSIVNAIDCNIVNSGSIDLDVSGGTAPYSYSWSNGEATQDLLGISAGDYSVEITDANGCSITKLFNIFRQDPININFEETIITDCYLKIVSKQVEANVTGGYLPYTYTWSAGTVSGLDNSIMTTSKNGSYVLTITDNKGCTESKSFLINVPTIGDTDFRYSAFSLNKYDLLSIEDPLQFTNLSTGDYSSITWDFGDGSPITTEVNPVHTYDEVGTFTVTLKVTYDAGCTEIVERIVNITKGYSLINPTAFTPNGDGYNEAIRPSYRGFMEIEMTIYSTWGTTIYYEKGTNLNGWNGTIKGQPAENGNYVMVVRGLTFYKKEITTSTPLTLLK